MGKFMRIHYIRKFKENIDKKLMNRLRIVLNKHDPMGIYFGKKVNFGGHGRKSTSVSGLSIIGLPKLQDDQLLWLFSQTMLLLVR